MHDLGQKLEHLKWLNAIGVEYYYSTKKDSTQLPINKVSLKNKESTNTMFTQYSRKNTLEIETFKMSRELANQANSLEELKNTIENFDGCDLKQFATHTVFADGNTRAKILFLGEAPGATEDKYGIPFCGESGKLLDKMLASISLSRERDVYITNTIFWRPPANRRPTHEEIEICRPFVEKHIALIDPKLIILVGSTASNSLLGQGAKISYVRNCYHSYTNQYLNKPITTTAIFHPAYLLRQPNKKKETWFDLIKIQQFILENI